MTAVRATGSAPITAASASLGRRPAPALRGALGAATFLAAAFFAGFVAAAPVPPADVAIFLVATFLAGALPKVLRGGNLLPPSRGANSKVTLPSSLFHARKALKARRVRMLTNL